MQIETPDERPDTGAGAPEGNGPDPDRPIEPELLLSPQIVEQVVNFSWAVGSLVTREPWAMVTDLERQGMIPLLTDDLNSDEWVRKLLSKMDGKMGYVLYGVSTWTRLGPIVAARRAAIAAARGGAAAGAR